MTDYLDQFIKLIFSFGAIGLLILAILDSTIFFFLPFAVDAVLIILISHKPPWMPVYALITVAGSLGGCALTYYIVSKASEQTLDRKFPKRKLDKVKKRIKDKGFAGLIITSLLPPPFPFSPFVAAAAVTKFPVKKTFAAIAIGRTLRYFADGFLALILGRQILRWMNSDPFRFFMLGLFILAAVGTAISVYKWVRR